MKCESCEASCEGGRGTHKSHERPPQLPPLTNGALCQRARFVSRAAIVPHSALSWYIPSSGAPPGGAIMLWLINPTSGCATVIICLLLPPAHCLLVSWWCAYHLRGIAYVCAVEDPLLYSLVCCTSLMYGYFLLSRCLFESDGGLFVAYVCFWKGSLTTLYNRRQDTFQW